MLTLMRARLPIAHCPAFSVRHASTAQPSPTRSPRDLYNRLSQYVIGQDRAKKILSVAVYNHYQRVAPLLAPQAQLQQQLSPSSPLPPPPTPSRDPEPSVKQQGPSAPSPEAQDWEQQPRFDADFDKTNGIPDSTRVVGAEDGSDPTMTHDPLSREEKWARGDGYFSSRRPSLLSKLNRRGDGPDLPTEAQSPSSGNKGVQLKKSWISGENERRRKEDAARARRIAELNEAIAPPDEPDVVVEKSNVLMIGPTGTGKTLMARTLAKALDVPFVSCDATTYTQAGYVGDDVESCVLRLLQAADYDVTRAEVGIIHIDEVDKLARRGGNEFGTWGGGRDVGGEGVQQALLRILEGTTLTLSAKAPPISSNFPGTSTHSSGTTTPPPSTSIPKPDKDWEWDPNNPMGRTFGAAPGKKGVREGLPGGGFGAGETAKKGDTFLVDTSNILFILSGAFVGLDAIVSKRLGKGSIGFGAPLAVPVAADALKATAADLKDYGLIPEFLGRLPVLSALHPLAINDLIRILTEPRNALVKQYKTLFKSYDCELVFTRFALEAIAQEGLDRGGGARGLRGVMEEILVDAMFEVPGSSVKHCLITQATVQRRQPALYFSRGQRHVFEQHLDAESGKPRRRGMVDEDDEKLRAVG